MLQRAELSQVRLDLLLDTMEGDVIAPRENLIPLREDLARHFQDDRFLSCESMGALVRQNLRHLHDEDHRTRP
jgi:hypothetical protein